MILKAPQSPSLIAISAPSGAGKTTMCMRLVKDLAPHLALSISCTTRKPRGSERDGDAYHFLTRADFESKIQAGLFAEWANVHGNYYGTSRETIDAAFAQGQSVLLDIDVQGADSLAKAYPTQTIRILIEPPSLAELEARLRARGTDSEETIQTRLRAARAELEAAKSFEFSVINDNLEHAYAQLREIVVKRLGLEADGLTHGSGRRNG